MRLKLVRFQACLENPNVLYGTRESSQPRFLYNVCPSSSSSSFSSFSLTRLTYYWSRSCLTFGFVMPINLWAGQYIQIWLNFPGNSRRSRDAISTRRRIKFLFPGFYGTFSTLHFFFFLSVSRRSKEFEIFRCRYLWLERS